jgi:DNA-binding winged helix-turn-helix (wHTH) protein
VEANVEILARPVTYREEVVAPIMDCIRAGESCAIIGISGTGKSNLFQFILRDDVKQRYWGENWKSYLLILVDSHSLRALNEWAVFELFLHSVLERVEGLNLAEETMARLEQRYEKVVESENPLLAQRYFELAMHMLCRQNEYRMVFLIDQFDEIWRELPNRLLANLRGVRDKHKYMLSYVVATRDELSRIREPVDEAEDFWELVSLNVLGLKPFSHADAKWIIQHWIARTGTRLEDQQASSLIKIAGTHPAILRAAFWVVSEGEVDVAGEHAKEQLLHSPRVWGECLKIWDSIAEDEQGTLLNLASGAQRSQIPLEVAQLLELKGLINNDGDGMSAIFCLLFAEFVARQRISLGRGIRIDKQRRIVQIEGRTVDDLTSLEFELLKYLFDNQGRVCTREQLIKHLYPDEYEQTKGDIADNRVDAIVLRLRQKIEPTRSKPRYVRNVRGAGFIMPGDNE